MYYDDLQHKGGSYFDAVLHSIDWYFILCKRTSKTCNEKVINMQMFSNILISFFGLIFAFNENSDSFEIHLFKYIYKKQNKNYLQDAATVFF